MNMKIIKRNGSQVDFNPSKIHQRIKKQAEGLNVNIDEIFIKVTSGIADGMTTKELDNLTAVTAEAITYLHPDYSRFAARICVSRHHKETEESFMKITKQLYELGSLDEEYYKIVKDNRDIIQKAIDYDRDYNLDYLGWSRLKQIYLLKDDEIVIERPQHMYMRVALWTNYTIEEAIDFYHELSNKNISSATPTMMNSGTEINQLASCNLNILKDDSRDAILQTFNNICISSSNAEGIGLAIHNLRSRKSSVGKEGGKAGGLTKFVKIVNEGLRFFNQRGKRSGSCAIYLEPWHKDIVDLLEITLEGGKEENRARDIFTAMWIPDNFMRAVKNDTDWYLFCPNDIKKAGLKPLHEIYGDEYEAEYQKAVDLGIGEKVKASEIWMKLIESQIETGVPYMAYKDHANRKTNQQNIGTIKSSNLCVAPETQILTDQGYITIGDNAGKEVNVWNGEEFSTTTIVKTGENQKLIKISFSNGQTIECTEYHKFYTQQGYNKGTGKDKLNITEKRANELKEGDKLIKCEFPILHNSSKTLLDAYTQGFFTGDGCSYKGKNHIDLYCEKLNLHEFLTGNLVGTYCEKQKRQRFSVNDYYVKYFVPLDYSIQSKLEWFAGLCDSDGVLCKNGKTEHLQIASTHKDFLINVQYMLQTLGVNSKITTMSEAGFKSLPNHIDGNSEYYCQTTYRILVGSDALYNLQKLGFTTNRLLISGYKPNRNCENFIKVNKIEDLGRTDDTYCVNEPKRHKVIFNGIITGNCAEVFQVTDSQTTAICSLGSLPLQKCVVEKDGKKYFDHNLLFKRTKMLARSINRVVDVNKYSTQEGENGGLKQRAIGIGVQGLADTFAMLGYNFISEESKKLNKEISETIYFAALTASNQLAKEQGETYHYYEGSPISKGIFQFNMWGVSEDDLSGIWDWKELRKNIIKYGVRNSLVTAYMPTASSASVIGSNEAFEPFNANLYVRKVIGGEFPVINKYMVKDLEDEGLWNDYIAKELIKNGGSISNIPVIPDYIKERYKTVYELSQSKLIEMSADRGLFIDQSQSLNIFMANPTVGKLTSSHFKAWELGLKTGMYYLRSKPVEFKGKHLGIDTQETKTSNGDFSCDGCSA